MQIYVLLWASLVAQMVKKICLQYRRPGFDPLVGKIPQRKEWLLTPIFLPGEFHGQRSLVGYSPWGRKKLDMTKQLTFLLLSLLHQKKKKSHKLDLNYVFSPTCPLENC